MTELYTIYYLLCLAMSVGLLIKAFFEWRGRSNSFCVGIFLLLTIVTLGYYWMFRSVCLEEAMLGYKLILLAECLIPPLSTFYFFDLCDIKCKKRIIIFAFVLSLVLFGLVITPSLTDEVFGAVSISHDNGLVVIDESYGIVHNIIFALIFIYLIIDIIAFLSCYSSKKNISFKSIILLCSCVSFAAALFLIIKLISLPFDFSIICVLIQMFLLIIIVKTKYYTLSEAIAKEIISDEKIGYVLFDDNRRKLISNSAADEWFRDIKELRTDVCLSKQHGICNTFLNWIERIDKGEKKIVEMLESGNKYINVSMEKYDIGKYKSGYRVIMRNDTDKQKLIELLSKEKSEALYRSQLVTKAIESYMDPSVVSQLLKEKEAETTSGLGTEIVVLFADIRGFTSFSDGKSPEDVLTLLNSIFELMTSCIMQNRGTIDKFIGDCVMAVWQLSKEPDASYLACKTSIDMRDALRVFNDGFRKEYGTEIRVGIGINKGTAVMGNVGTEMRRDYTCIGDTVNIASRLEEMARGGETLITKAVRDDIEFRSETELISSAAEIRGKSKGIELFELKSVGGRK